MFSWVVDFTRCCFVSCFLRIFVILFYRFMSFSVEIYGRILYGSGGRVELVVFLVGLVVFGCI